MKKNKFVFIFLVIIFLCGCAREEAQTILGMTEEAADTGSERNENAVLRTEQNADLETGQNLVSKLDADSGAGISPGSRSSETEMTSMAVFVCGAVQNPGVYYFDAGTRVCEAVEAAGGFLSSADQEWLNLADFLQDGQKLKVWTKEETAAAGETGGPDGRSDAVGSFAAGQGNSAQNDAGQTGAGLSGETDSRINLNTAGKEELMTLSGIGESRAEAVLQYRSEHGGFGRIEDIMNINGIKEAVFSKIKDQITV